MDAPTQSLPLPHCLALPEQSRGVVAVRRRHGQSARVRRLTSNRRPGFRFGPYMLVDSLAWPAHRSFACRNRAVPVGAAPASAGRQRVSLAPPRRDRGRRAASTRGQQATPRLRPSRGWPRGSAGPALLAGRPPPPAMVVHARVAAAWQCAFAALVGALLPLLCLKICGGLQAYSWLPPAAGARSQIILAEAPASCSPAQLRWEGR